MRVHEQIKELKSINDDIKDDIITFMKYLVSSKFHHDTMIQSNEVYNFLLQIRNKMI